MVEPAVATVLEEMLDDLDQTADAEGRPVSTRLDALVAQAETVVLRHYRDDLGE